MIVTDFGRSYRVSYLFHRWQTFLKKWREMKIARGDLDEEEVVNPFRPPDWAALDYLQDLADTGMQLNELHEVRRPDRRFDLIY